MLTFTNAERGGLTAARNRTTASVSVSNTDTHRDLLTKKLFNQLLGDARLIHQHFTEKSLAPERTQHTSFERRVFQHMFSAQKIAQRGRWSIELHRGHEARGKRNPMRPSIRFNQFKRSGRTSAIRAIPNIRPTLCLEADGATQSSMRNLSTRLDAGQL